MRIKLWYFVGRTFGKVSIAFDYVGKGCMKRGMRLALKHPAHSMKAYKENIK